jgi:hypothetical protein
VDVAHYNAATGMTAETRSLDFFIEATVFQNTSTRSLPNHTGAIVTRVDALTEAYYRRFVLLGVCVTCG